MYKSISHFEVAYLQRSLTRLFDPINAENRMSKSDIDRLIAVISLEIDAVSFDQGLLKNVSRNIGKALGLFVARHEAGGLEVVNSAWYLRTKFIDTLADIDSGATVAMVVKDAVGSVFGMIYDIVEPVLQRIAGDLERVLMGIHAEASYKGDGGAGISPYVNEFTGRVRQLQKEVLGRIQCSENRGWIKTIVARCIHVFLMNASVVRYTEGGKLRLANDMTQIEFTMNQWLNVYGAKLEGEGYIAMRGFRQLLFVEDTQVVDLKKIGVPIVIATQHLMTRGMRGVMDIKNWTPQEWWAWVDAKEDDEVIEVLKRCVVIYEDEVRKRGEKEYCAVWTTVRSLLRMQ